MQQLGLMQIIKKPTRISNTKNSILDVIFTNSNFISSSGVGNVNISDHELIYCVRKKVKVKRNSIDFQGRSYRNFDGDQLVRNFDECDWNEFDQNTDPDILWQIYDTNIRLVLDTMCPIKNFKIARNRDPWISDDLINEIKHKDFLLKRAKKTKSQFDWLEARLARNTCLRHIRLAKSDLIKNEIDVNKHDSRKFWQNIKTIIPDSKTSLNHFNLNDEEGNQIPDIQTSDFINSFFASIGPKLARNFDEEWAYHGEPTEDIMPDFEIEIDDIVKYVKEISEYKASAVTNIPSKILKLVFLHTPAKLKKIFDNSILFGKIPQAWKHATIIPLRKEGNSKDVNNLRPVSLLSLPGKILEKLIQNKLSHFLETNQILDGKQGGFRPKHSTTDTAVTFTEDLYLGMNTKQFTVAVFVDLRKAFDTVNHKILLKKIEKIGINFRLRKWFADYLSNGTQSTFANNIYSEALSLTCGVPQGSVLGPTLFLIYINDVKNVLSQSKHLLYADDTVLYITDNSLDRIENNLQLDLVNFSQWCVQNVLTVNTKKTKYVIYGTSKRLKRSRNLDLSIANNQLEREQVYKYLGIYLDSQLNFNKHIDYVNRITSHKIFVLAKIRHFIDQRTALFIYKSMISPIFDYGDIVYEGGKRTG